jgi:hypothetical protein
MRSGKGLVTLGCTLAATVIVLSPGRAGASESPWYVEAAFGQASAEASLGSRHSKWIDDENGAATVALGYRVNRHLAIQAGYHDLGDHYAFGSPCRQTDDECIQRLANLELCVEGTECAQVLLDLDADLSGFSLAAVPSWGVSERVSVRGKVGIMAWDSEVRGPLDFGPIESFTGEDLLLGIGLEYGFSSGLGLLLEYSELDLDVSTTALGVSWNF